MTVAVFSWSDDAHALGVVGALEQVGIAAVVLESDRYCETWTASWLQSPTQERLVFEGSFGRLDSRDISTLWIRREPVSLRVAEETGDSRYLESQRVLFLHNALHWLGSTVRCVDPLANIQRAKSKLLQLSVARHRQLLTPETYVGGSPTLANSWMMELDRPLCSKAIEAGHLETEDGRKYARFTTQFERRSLEELVSLAKCPVIIQSFVSKLVELRVTVVGEDIFTASIDTSSAHADSRVDWRHYDWANTRYETFELPNEVKQKVRMLMSDLGLTYGALDFVLTADNEYVFLEVNPTGQYLWIEDLTDLPITQAMAGHLGDV